MEGTDLLDPGIQVYLYARRNELEEEAVKQFIALAESPLPVGYVSAMPGTPRNGCILPASLQRALLLCTGVVCL